MSVKEIGITAKAGSARRLRTNHASAATMPEGCSRFMVFLPLTRPGLIGAGTLVFILSLGFFVTPALLGGGKVLMIAEYVAVQINDTLRWGLGTMLAATLMISVLGALWALSRVIDVRRLFGA